MSKVLLGTNTRCKLQNIQGTYAKKYSNGQLLEHEETYILDSFKFLFDDVKDFFGKDLIMFDAYYLTQTCAEQINNICIQLTKQNKSYSKLVAGFNPQYPE
jgi:hypothetical protein